jgi:hypothetical protein
MMPSEKPKLGKSRKGNIEPNVVDRISILMTRMEHQERRDGPRNRCDRERSGRRTVLINLVCPDLLSGLCTDIQMAKRMCL